MPGNLFQYDLQGWNSQHAYLADAIAVLRPRIIVEIGVWKGGSTVFMANELKKLDLGPVVIAVDTWLGSSEHWTGPSHVDLSMMNGRPNLYFKFLSNVVQSGVADYVLPLPMDWLNAAEVMKTMGIAPDLVHLDGGHDYHSVTAALCAWWPVLAAGGMLIGDDYYTGGTWITVRRAFDDFFGGLNLSPLEDTDGKCRIRKPA